MKKLISVALALVMLLSMSVVAFAEATTTVSCQAPDSWTECYAYWWGSSTACSNWPGEPMTKGADGSWSFDIPSDLCGQGDGTQTSPAGVIFNNNAGAQTGNLIAPTDDKTQFVFAANEWVVPGTEIEIVTKYYVTGSASLCGVEFDPADANNLMTEGENGLWTKTYTGVPAGEHQLKVTDGTWNNTWYDDVTGTDGGYDNYVLTLDETSDVTVTFDAVNEIVTVTVNGEPAPTDPTDPTDPTQPGTTEYYLIGYINGQDYDGTDNKFVDGNVTVTFNAESYVYVKDSAGNVYMTEGWQGNEATSVNLYTFPISGDKLFVPAQELTFTLVENDDGSLTLSYAAGGDVDSTDPTDPTDPTNNSTEPTDPTDPTDSTDSTDPTEPTNTPSDTIGEYYLVGYIDGQDYDGTDNKFVNGKVTVTFNTESYVYVKNAEGATYMTEDWLGKEVTSATLYTNPTKADKLFVPAQELTFTVAENDDGTLTLSYVAGGDTDTTDPTNPSDPTDPTNPTNPTNPTDPTDPTNPGTETPATYKITAKVPSTWASCYLYAWTDNAGSNANWPGVAMTKNADGSWSADLDSKYNKLIIAEKDGGAQTVDLDAPGKATTFVLKAEPNAEGKFELESSVSKPSDPTDPTTPSGNTNPTTPSGSTNPTTPSTGSNEKYYVAGVGALCGAEWKENDANNIMAKDTTGIWFKTYQNVAKGNYSIKVTDGTWDNSWGGDGQDGNYEFTVAADKTTVVVKFDAAAKKVTVEVGGKVPTPAPTTPTTGNNNGTVGNNGSTQKADENVTGPLSAYRVVGSADWMGNWDPASDAGRMHEVSTGVYKKNFENVQPGNYELKITKDGKWDESWGDNGNNYTFTVVKACTITVSFTLATGAISVYGEGIGDPGTGDYDMIGVMVMMGLAVCCAGILILNKKKFI